MTVGDGYNATAHLNAQNELDLSEFDAISATLNVTVEHSYILYLYLTKLNAVSLLRTDTHPDAPAGPILGLANFATAGLKELVDSLFNYVLPRGLYGTMLFA